MHIIKYNLFQSCTVLQSFWQRKMEGKGRNIPSMINSKKWKKWKLEKSWKRKGKQKDPPPPSPSLIRRLVISPPGWRSSINLIHYLYVYIGYNNYHYWGGKYITLHTFIWWKLSRNIPEILRPSNGLNISFRTTFPIWYFACQGAFILFSRSLMRNITL